MTEPKFLLVTIEKAAMPDPRKPGHHQIMVIQPPIQRLFLLATIEMARQQNGERLEIVQGLNVLTCQEHFADAVEALEAAARSGLCVVRPVIRGRIEEAATAAVGGGLSVVPKADASRQPTPGDLRVIWADPIGYIVQCWNLEEDSKGEWACNKTPLELLQTYHSVEAAELAIKAAGYSRRLLKGA